jgi:uncharacterized membrane protein
MESPGLVTAILPVHILGGGLALVFGYTALWASKGATLHRKSGLFFVAAMVTMSLTGALIAALGSEPVSVVAGLLTFYFVTTSLLTVRRRPDQTHWIDRIALLVALTIGALAFKVGLDSLGRIEAPPMFIFGLMGLLGAVGDVRMIRAGGIRGPRRMTRHLWRMCFAMWVAAASFFWGPPGRVPDVINIPALLPIPVMAPIVVMLYWLWRIRIRGALSSLVVRERSEVTLAVIPKGQTS